MAHQHIHRNVHKKEAASTVAASILSIIFSIIASSHHLLHMGILLILGGSTNLIAGMAGMLLLRRVMVIATLTISLFSIYRLTKHKHVPIWMKGMSLISVLISFGFIIYTVYNFGW